MLFSADGRSDRFGEVKTLLPLKGRPLIKHVAGLMSVLPLIEAE